VLTLWSCQVSDLDQVDGYTRTSKQDERPGSAMAAPPPATFLAPPEAVLVSGLDGASEVAADLGGLRERRNSVDDHRRMV
jgi:hypothetical protein